MGDIGVVEAAPDTVDLNALLGMTDEEIEAVATADSYPDVVTEEEEIDEPHITVATKKLLDVLKISAMIAAAGENSFEGKVAVFNIEQDDVKFLLSDNKRNIQKTVDIVNQDKRFTGFLAFTTSTLARLIKVCGSTFSIIERVVEVGEKKEKKYVLKITGGEIHLDNINMSRDKFIKDFSDSSIKEYNKENIVSSISRLFTFASTSIKTGKNIDFNGNVIQAAPINSLAKITFEETYPNFRLSLTDARILYLLASTDDSEKVGINSEGKIFSGNTYKFRTESFNTNACAFDSVAERMFTGESAAIDSKHLSKITDLSVGLDTSIGNLKFNFTEDGHVECELLTKRENSKIIIQGTTNTDLVPLENPVEVPASNLKGALSIFSTETILNMRVTPDGVSLQSGNVRVSVLGKNVGK